MAFSPPADQTDAFRGGMVPIRAMGVRFSAAVHRRALVGRVGAGILLAGVGQRPDCRSVQHLSIGRELRSVTWTIPAFLEAVPVDDAADVSADGGAADDLPVFAFVDRHLCKAVPNDRALAPLQLVGRLDLARP